MSTLLHIKSSPRKQRSASVEVADSFISRYLENQADTKIMTLDLWDMPLPDFDELAMGAKYAGLSGTPLSIEQETTWATLQALAAFLHQADLLVLSVPMWNFSIPYRLKHFIDLVTQKNILFRFDPEQGFEGMLHGKRAVVAYARGLDFLEKSTTPAAQFDFQKPYVEAWLRFVGVSDVRSIVVEKTIFSGEIDLAARQQASDEARALADSLS